MIGDLIYANMTKKQARRMKLFCFGKTLTQIAKKEKVTIGAISQSIKAAKERVRRRNIK